MGGDSVQTREKHKYLYFADGNVVLLALRADSNSGVLFRVHKSILSMHSPVFSDMFNVCNPLNSTSGSEDDHFSDGMPLIRLADNADHLGSLLEILYYRSDLPCMPRNPLYPTIITPIFDLSRKYGIDRVYAQIVRHLESDWPQTVNDWDKLEREIAEAKAGSYTNVIDDHFPEPVAAIRLSHQFDIPTVLPAAFYHLSRLSILDDWDKTRADPSIVRDTTKRTAQWKLLSAKDFRCLLLGKAELANLLRGCINPRDLRHVCIHASASGKRETRDPGEEMWKDILDKCLHSTDPLALLKGLQDEDNCSRCTKCVNTQKAKIQVVRTQIWERLGDLFHLKDD